MEIYKDLSNPASKEFEQLLNSQFTKTANLEEGKIITDAAKEMKIYEGLHEDNTLKLYPGFLMRGSCHRFIHKLNTRMREFRWQTRNKTLALPEALEHTGVDL